MELREQVAALEDKIDTMNITITDLQSKLIVANKRSKFKRKSGMRAVEAPLIQAPRAPKKRRSWHRKKAKLKDPTRAKSAAAIETEQDETKPHKLKRRAK